MFGVSGCAQAKRMSKLLPGVSKASSDQVSSNWILEEQSVGGVPPHLSDGPSVLLESRVHIVWTWRDGVKGRSEGRRHG